MKATERCWRYHPNHEARIFDEGQEIPAGWVDTPDKFGQEAKSINEMSKEELEIHARTFGVELDRRKSKLNMLKDFEDAIDDRG
jgi:hypothetical protein